MNSAPSSSQYHERDFVPEWLTPRPFDATLAWRQIGVLKQKVNFYIGSWLISFILVAASYQLLFSLSSFSWGDWSNIIYKSLVSLFFCLMIVLAALAIDQSKSHLFKYVLFFSITITSAFGLTKTLTGSHAESGNIHSLWLFFLYRIDCLSTSFQAPKREVYCCRVESAIVNYGSDSHVFLVYTALFIQEAL